MTKKMESSGNSGATPDEELEQSRKDREDFEWQCGEFRQALRMFKESVKA
jgi:hypothetical protein